jgi:hypothetical protein
MMGLRKAKERTRPVEMIVEMSEQAKKQKNKSGGRSTKWWVLPKAFFCIFHVGV